MKRSEMIKKMSHQIAVMTGGQYTKQEIDDIGSALLLILENNGMQPPLVSGNLAGYIADGEWENE